MRSSAWFFILLATTLSLLGTGSAAAQTAGVSDTVAIIDAVMTFRLTRLQDRAPLGACVTFYTIGRPEGFPAKLSARVRSKLDQDLSTCFKDPVVRSNKWCPIVYIDSVGVADSTATLKLTQSEGEYLHRQLYQLTRSRKTRTSRSIWSVESVTLSGFMRVYRWTSLGPMIPNGPKCPHTE